MAMPKPCQIIKLDWYMLTNSDFTFAMSPVPFFTAGPFREGSLLPGRCGVFH